MDRLAPKTFAALAFAMAALAVAGPQKRLPYTTLEHPAFVPASRADFMQPDYRVIGIAAAGVVKAYPAAIVGQHGVVLDRLPDGPIAVTW